MTAVQEVLEEMRDYATTRGGSTALRANEWADRIERALAPAGEVVPVSWQQQAYASLGFHRDRMHPDVVAAVQAFLEGDYASPPAAPQGWREVIGHSDYEVSSWGTVRVKGGFLLGQWDKAGYPQVRLSNPRAVCPVHRLVAAAFVPNPDGKPFVNHIDCDTRNNCAENLEWCTQTENLAHSARLGRMQRDYWTGKRSPAAKLTDAQADEVRSLRAAGMSLGDIAAKVGCSKRSALRIVQGKSYLAAGDSNV